MTKSPTTNRTRAQRLYGLLAEPQATRSAGIQLRRNEDDDEEEVLVYDVIDPFFGASSAAFAEALGGVRGTRVTVRINSPGGDVFEGRAMATQLRAFRGTTRVVVDGLAASAASTVALAAQRTEMAAGSFLMVHRSWAFAMGNATDLTSLASLLGKIDEEIAKDYAAKSGVSQEEAIEWMEDETWFTADEAVEAKLADAVIDVKAQRRAFNLAAFERVPAELLKPINNTETSVQQWEANARRLRLLG